MSRFWTHHWSSRHWRVNPDYRPMRGSVGNRFRKRGIAPGDILYVVSIAAGRLWLGGRVEVASITTNRRKAISHYRTANLYEGDEYLLGRKKTGTAFNAHRCLAPAVSRRLNFVSLKAGPKSLFFVSKTRLDVQATRGVRELTPESAALLDRIIEITDRMPRTPEVILVTENLLRRGQLIRTALPHRLPEEVPDGRTYPEGAVERVTVNRYERDSRNRNACISYHGVACMACGFDFGDAYGPDMAGFIHVHHLELLSGVQNGYEPDPVKDLCPVCPNCHAVIHRRELPYSIEEVQQMMRASRKRRGAASVTGS